MTPGLELEERHIDTAQPREEPKRRFRADIEGLRAVAVALVLLYHAGLKQLPGGFIGVDIFFVISGFLITAHLVSEIRAGGTIRLGAFYARRAKRLLPAAALLLIVTAVLTVVVLPKTRWLSTGWDLIASMFYVMNWRLAAQSVNYLEAGSSPSPVQHFWSLAVEEQYYLVWPLLLIVMAVMFRAVRRWRRGVPTRRRGMGNGPWADVFLAAAFAVVFVPSFWWSIHNTRTSPGPAYFVTTDRLWELALGAMVAIAAAHLTRIPRPVAAIAGWVGLAAIVATALLLTTATPFPGWITLVPTAAAGLVIASGPAAGRFGPGVLLTLRPATWLGGISYSAYLWHWPLLVLATAQIGQLSLRLALAIVAGSVLVAWGSTRLVENPIRFTPRLSSLGRSAAVGVVASLAVTFAALAVLFAAGPPPPPPYIPVAAAPQGGADAAPPHGAEVLGPQPAGNPNGVAVDRVDTFTPTATSASNDLELCLGDETGTAVRTCTYGDQSSSKVVVLVGDSHAGQFIPPLAQIAAQRGWKLLAFIKPLCPYADVLEPQEGGGAVYQSCADWNTAVAQRLGAMTTPPILLVTSSIQRSVLIDGHEAVGNAAVKALSQGFRARWAPVIQRGTPVLAIGPTPWPDVNIPDCVSKNQQQLTKCAIPRAAVLSRSSSALEDAVISGPGAKYLDLFPAICPDDPCAPVIGGVLVYADRDHLTATYAASLRPRIEPAIDALVAPSGAAVQPTGG